MAWCILGLAVVVFLRLLLPLVLVPVLTSRLEKALGVPTEIDDVGMRLWLGELTVHGLRAAPPAETSASRISLEKVIVRIGWRDVLRGLPFLHVAVTGVDVTLDLQRPWPATRGGGGSGFDNLRTLHLEGGTVAVVLDPDAPPILQLTELRAGLLDSSTGTRRPMLTSDYWATAQTGEGGTLALEGAFAPVDTADNWTLRFVLQQLDLRPLNPLFARIFEMDVHRGSLTAEGELTVGLGRLRGRILPQFESLELLGGGAARTRHPMAEALFESMLSSADVPIVIDQPFEPGGGFSSDDAAQANAMDLVSQVILRGFIRRLDTLDGYVSAASRIEVNFPTGRMSFFDVELTKKNGNVSVPFVEVAQLDIIVETSAVDDEITTYKAIVLHQPSLVFVNGASAAQSQREFDPDWQEKVSVLPYPTDRIQIIGGRIEYRDTTTDPPTSLYVGDIDLSATNLGRARAGKVLRAARLKAQAKVMDLSPLAVVAEFSPGAVPLDAALRLQLDPLPLSELNDLLRGRMGIDITGGTLAVDGDFDVRGGQLRGTLTPQLPGVRVIGMAETEFQRPIREFMLERRLRKLDAKTIEVDYAVQESLVRELPGALLSAALRAGK